MLPVNSQELDYVLAISGGNWGASIGMFKCYFKGIFVSKLLNWKVQNITRQDRKNLNFCVTQKILKMIEILLNILTIVKNAGLS